MASKKSSNMLGLIAFIAMFINFVYWIISIINSSMYVSRNYSTFYPLTSNLLNKITLTEEWEWDQKTEKLTFKKDDTKSKLWLI